MRFLIDADLPRSTKDLLRRYGHEGVDVRDVGLGQASDSRILRYAQDEALCVLSGDHDFSDVRTYPPAQYHGLVILNVPPSATAASILSLLEGFLKHGQVVNSIVGRLAIVESGRVRIRPSSESSPRTFPRPPIQHLRGHGNRKSEISRNQGQPPTSTADIGAVRLAADAPPNTQAERWAQSFPQGSDPRSLQVFTHRNRLR